MAQKYKKKLKQPQRYEKKCRNLENFSYLCSPMNETKNTEPVKWYVLTAVFKREVKIRDDMRSHGFDCYVPLRYEIIKKAGNKRERKLVPAINELVFVHSTKSAIKEYKDQQNEKLFFRTTGRKENRELMVVQDKDMENFMRVTQQVEENLTYYRPGEISFRVGDKIIIHGGVFDGVEGVLVRVPGKRSKQLVVSIPEIAAVAVSLSPEVVELVDQPVQKSTDVEGDTKTLFTMAFQKLVAPPDRIRQEHEYNILVVELKRVLSRLELRKGYTAAREAEIALAVYAATKALELDDTAVARRLAAAAEALKSTSMLRLRLQLYQAVLEPSPTLLQAIEEKVKEWKSKPLSEQQRKFIDEMNKLQHVQQPAD